MSRLVLVLALVAGVACPTSALAERDRSDDSSSKKKSKKKKSAEKSKKKSKKSKRKDNEVTKRSKRDSSRGVNMPRGFSWPPTRAMLAAEEHCISKLDKTGIDYKKADREGRIVRAVIVPSMKFGGVQFSSNFRNGPHKMDCHFALAMHRIGPTLYELGVREVRFGSLFRWSNVRHHGSTKPILSRHALGLAMDIAAFIDAEGHKIVVEKDYTMADPLLLNIEDAFNDSGFFRTVLTPKNDPISHDDHFHIEAASDFTAPNS
jgi:hypothetical protein